jgi:cephalosporin hydroxylase
MQIWQLPEDILRLQEVIASIKPDVIIETGVNQGGSSIFFASLCRMLGRGRVISIDIQVPPEVRQAIEQSPFGDLITLIEGDSASPEVIAAVKAQVAPGESVFVFLDSDHSKAHVRRELDAFGPLVTPGSYIVAADGIMERLTDTPNGDTGWALDNPAEAAREYHAAHPEFALRRPAALFGDEKTLDNLTYLTDAWLHRLTD